MKHLESKSFNKTHLLILALIAGIGIVFVLVLTKKYGTGFSADSVIYISAADSLLDGKGFIMHNGDVYASWPPLYPALLAMLKSCGLDYIASTRYINAVTFGFVMFLSGLWVLKNTSRVFLAILCSLGMLLSKPLFYVFPYAWSETIFFVLLMLYFLILPSVIKEPSVKRVVALGVVTAAACLTRYIGGLLFVIVVVLLMFNREHPFRKRLSSTGVFGIVSVLPLGLWLLRNWVLTDTLAGPRFAADVSLWSNIDRAGERIGSWFLPDIVTKSLPAWLFLCLFWVLIAVIAIFVIRRSSKHKQYWLNSPAVMLVSFLVLYTTALTATVTGVMIEPLNDRYLAPIYIAAVLLFFTAFGNIFPLDTKLTQGKKDLYVKFIRGGIVGGIFIGIWFASGTTYVLNRAQRAIKYGAGGRNTTRWHQSETVTWLKRHKLSGEVFSNNGCTVYFFSRYRTRPAPHLPELKKCTSPELREMSERQVAEFKKVLQSQGLTYLVWFLPPRSDSYNLKQLQDFCRMRIVEKFRDGAIIALYPK